MKKKEETKKLTLNKITIAPLDKDQIDKAKGGESANCFFCSTMESEATEC